MASGKNTKETGKLKPVSFFITLITFNLKPLTTHSSSFDKRITMAIEVRSMMMM